MQPATEFSILAVSPFSFSTPKTNSVIPVPANDVSKTMANAAVSLSIPMDKRICSEGELNLTFKTIADFTPIKIVENNTWLCNLQSAANYIADAMQAGTDDQEIYRRISEWENLPVRFSAPGPAAEAPPAKETDAAIDDILSMVDTTGQTARSAAPAPLEWKTAINELLEKNLDAVFADSGFIATEAAWLGMVLLAQTCEAVGDIFLKALSIGEGELDTIDETLGRAFAQDAPDLVLFGFNFDNTPRSLGRIERIASVCDQHLVPAAINIKERFFHIDSWEKTATLPYLPHFLEESQFAKWKSITAAPQARWIAAACNDFTIEDSTGDIGPAIVAGLTKKPAVRIAPTWALGALCAQSIRFCGWPTRFASHNTMRLDNALPVSDVSEEKAADFVKAGFMLLCEDTRNKTAFFSEETSIAGVSLAEHFIIARSVAFFLKLRQQIDIDLPDNAMEEQINTALNRFWESTCGETPNDASVTLSAIGTDQRVLQVSFTPPAVVLPKGTTIAYELLW